MRSSLLVRQRRIGSVLPLIGAISSASPVIAQEEGASAPTPEASPTDKPIEIVVTGTQSDAVRLQQSADAVTVKSTRKDQRRTADMGQVLARTQGIAVRRSGGLGTDTRIFLNGLHGDQVRFFMDGLPLELAGYPLDIATVPVNFVERLEVYRGVVPIRFGADALGGAINLVSNQRYETGFGASYQVGSFGTHRVNASGRYRHEPTGVVFGLSTFFDVTQNNYEVDVNVPRDDGRQVAVTVPRFHDAYQAYGANLELGIVERDWARRLVLKAFQTGFHKEIQNNNVMEVVYGEITAGETIRGLTGRYEVELSPDVELEIVASYTHRAIEYTDKSLWVYNWFGQRVNERRTSGEASEDREDNRLWEHGLFARALLGWMLAPGHVLQASVTPTFTTRTGKELLLPSPDAFDSLSATNAIFKLVSGLEYESSWFADRLSNVAFVKDYAYRSRASEPIAETDSFREMDVSVHRFGIGDSMRYRFTPWLLAKASYEYATRLPEPDEVFGNAQEVNPNLDLKPEASHNANLGPRLELEGAQLGLVTVDVNAFWRETDQQILLLGGESRSIYENVYAVRSYGFEGGASWATPDRFLNLEGTFTWQDLRNASQEGAFSDFEGDPLPNRPHLFGSWGGSLRLPGPPATRGSIELFYQGRYVHGFFRSWEGAGLRSSKQTIPAQTTHNAGVTWSTNNGVASAVSTFEVDNLLDAKVFDEFGVQRPGRAYYVKVTGEL